MTPHSRAAASASASTSTTPNNNNTSKMVRAPNSNSPSTASIQARNLFQSPVHYLYPPTAVQTLMKWPAAIHRPAVGLQNLGNSCFMNATLQALSHTPMLVNYMHQRQHSKTCSIRMNLLQNNQPQSSNGTAQFGPRPLGMMHNNMPNAPVALPPFCLFCALEDLLNVVYRSNGAHAPQRIFNRLRSISKMLRPGRQEDAHEFLRCALDFMQNNLLANELTEPKKTITLTNHNNNNISNHHRDHNGSTTSTLPPLPATSSIPPTLYATLSSAALHRIKETTVLYQIYGGYYRSSLTCNQCHQSSHTFEPFLDLSLSIPLPPRPSLPHQQQHHYSTQPFQFNRLHMMNGGQPTFSAMTPPTAPTPPLLLTAALTSFTSEEHLDRDNLYQCDYCHRKTRAVKKITIYKAPNVLVIHLKRFEGGGGMQQMYGGGKINRMVKYDMTLDLLPCMSDKESVKADMKYTLYAVLVHSGSSMHMGHYFSYVRAADDQWYLMNDSSVRPVSISEVLEQRAYMLFYAKNVPTTGTPSATTTSSTSLKNGTSVKDVKHEKKRASTAPIAAVESEKNGTHSLTSSSAQAGAIALPVCNGISDDVTMKEQNADKEHKSNEVKHFSVRHGHDASTAANTAIPSSSPEAQSDLSSVKGNGTLNHPVSNHISMSREPSRSSAPSQNGDKQHLHSVSRHITVLSSPASKSHTSTTSSKGADASAVSVITTPSLSVPLASPPTSPVASASTSAFSSVTSPQSTDGGLFRKRRAVLSSSGSPNNGLPGLPSFSSATALKHNAFAATINNSNNVIKRIKQQPQFRIVDYSSSSDDEQDEAKVKANHINHNNNDHQQHQMAPKAIIQTEQQVITELAATIPLTISSPQLPTSSVSVPSSSASNDESHTDSSSLPSTHVVKRKSAQMETTTATSTPASATVSIHGSVDQDHTKRQADDKATQSVRESENEDRRKRRILTSAPTYTLSASAAARDVQRFDPHQHRHQKGSQYGAAVSTWDTGDQSNQADAALQRERMQQVERQQQQAQSSRVKDAYDRELDRGHVRKVKSHRDKDDKDNNRDTENRFQQHLEQREHRDDVYRDKPHRHHRERSRSHHRHHDQDNGDHRHHRSSSHHGHRSSSGSDRHDRDASHRRHSYSDSSSSSSRSHHRHDRHAS